MAELKHLNSAWDVDRFIVLQTEKLVAIRFSAFESAASAREDRAHFASTAIMDAALIDVAPRVRNYCTVYAVDTAKVPEFNQLYELDDPADPFALMFFFKNKHIKVDVSSGNNNKINFPIEDREKLKDIMEEAYVAARKGQHLARSQHRFANARK